MVHAKAQQQTSVKTVFLHLIEPIVKDTDGIHTILHIAAFASKEHDEHTHYELNSNNVGLRLRGTLEHFEYLFIYGKFFHSKSEHENKYLNPSTFHTYREFELEFGAGMKFPIPIGNTGLILEGEFSTPFTFFNPVLSTQLKWENHAENFSVGIENSIFARNASIWNPGFYFEYKIPPRKQKRRKN